MTRIYAVCTPWQRSCSPPCLHPLRCVASFQRDHISRRKQYVALTLSFHCKRRISCSRQIVFGSADGEAVATSSKPNSEAGAFARAATQLRDRLAAAVEAERQAQLAVLHRLYARSSLKQLQEEGMVLTNLTAAEDGRLFSDFVWNLAPHPAAAQQNRAGQQGAAGLPRSQLRSSSTQPYNSVLAARASTSLTGVQRGVGSGQELPYHKFQRGDSVLISWGGANVDPYSSKQLGQMGSSMEFTSNGSEEDGDEIIRDAADAAAATSVEGTVLEAKRTHLLVTLPKDASATLEEQVEAGALLRLDKGEKDTTTRRQLEALSRLTTFRDPNNRGEALVRTILLGGTAVNAQQRPAWALNTSPDSWLASARTALHSLPGLNWSQRAAIVEALGRTFSLWQGPPGTGKTRTLLAFMQVLCSANRQRPDSKSTMGPILAAADTNAACDNLVEGLMARGVRVVRIGVPAKVRPELRAACLDAQVEATSSGRRAVDLREKSTELMNRVREEKRKGNMGRAELAELRQLADKSWKQSEQYIARATEGVLQGAEVIAATCTGCGDPRLRDMGFRVVVIDEASQATEPSTLIPLVNGAECVVLAGDIKQLPPTVASKKALKFGLDVPLLARLQTESRVPAQLLEMQYRMHPDIAQFSSKQFYQGQVKSGVAEEDRPLIKGVPWPNGVPVMFLHCTGREERASSSTKQAPGAAAEGRVEGGSSYQNRLEATKAVKLLQGVLAANPDVSSIAIITPYNGQVRLLTKLLRALGSDALPPGVDVAVSSVDGYQGREADLVIFSAVRSNKEGRIGFVADERRLNVAITRARRGLIVLGNGDTLRHDPNWRAWLQWLGGRLGMMAKPPAAGNAARMADGGRADGSPTQRC